jgi:hypothetical protein
MSAIIFSFSAIMAWHLASMPEGGFALAVAMCCS